jgi:CheY-like chemotaxis protein
VVAREKGHILVMDDDKVIRDVMNQMLEHLGYRAEFAGDVAAAVGLYREAADSGRSFDAVILDLTMPGGVGGKEALQELKEIDPHVRAIACSGYADDPILTNFSEYGFSAALAKPFRIENINNVLESVLAK